MARRTDKPARRWVKLAPGRWGCPECGCTWGIDGAGLPAGDVLQAILGHTCPACGAELEG